MWWFSIGKAIESYLILLGVKKIKNKKINEFQRRPHYHDYVTARLNTDIKQIAYYSIESRSKGTPKPPNPFRWSPTGTNRTNVLARF